MSCIYFIKSGKIKSLYYMHENLQGNRFYDVEFQIFHFLEVETFPKLVIFHA